MITKEMTIMDIVNTYPETIDVFNAKGLRGFDHQMILAKVGIHPLADVLKKKQIDVDLFVELLNDAIVNQQSDITLYNNFEKTANLNVVGLLPCPVRIPLMEQLNQYERLSEINFDLRAASEGLEWLKETVENAKNESDLADMYISAGFDLFFDEHLMKKFKDQNTFNDLTNMDYNSDFENEMISLKDPNHDYSMIAVVPAVFLINKKVLGDRPIPKKWSDLFDPIYADSLSFPVSDFDLFNAILIHIYKDYGFEGITKLGEAMVQALHPAQMVKGENANKPKQPAISVMPYFFTKMAIPGGTMEAVWPEDGAILSPIFMLTKQSKKLDLKPVVDLLASKKIGEILSHQGLFPSIHPEVENNLEGKPFKWVGWDFINSTNIGQLIEDCMEAFNKGVK